jgi:predicted anti-sigma-YlaC factor YlaD
VSDPRCEEFRELVSAFVDERLERPELLRLEGHLAVCAGCRAFEGDLRRLRELLQAGEGLRPLRRPPPGFAAAVAARAAREAAPRVVPFPAPGAPRRRVPAWVGLVAAAAIAVLYVGWSWQRLVPGEPAARRVAAQSTAPVTLAAATPDEGDMDAWMSQHALLARDGTLLGSAEEVEFASFRAGGQGR